MLQRFADRRCSLRHLRTFGMLPGAGPQYLRWGSFSPCQGTIARRLRPRTSKRYARTRYKRHLQRAIPSVSHVRVQERGLELRAVCSCSGILRQVSSYLLTHDHHDQAQCRLQRSCEGGLRVCVIQLRGAQSVTPGCEEVPLCAREQTPCLN